MSDKNLEQLIASIKTEAIDKAEKEAEKILGDAKLKAQALMKEAEQAKEEIVRNAKKDSADMMNKGKVALQQASRDLVLSLQNDLLNMFKTALESEIKSGFKADAIKSIILAVVESMGKGSKVDLPPETYRELSSFIQSKSSEIEFSEDKSLSSGIKITKTKEGWSYGVNPESVTEALLPLLNPTWVDILKGESC